MTSNQPTTIPCCPSCGVDTLECVSCGCTGKCIVECEEQNGACPNLNYAYCFPDEDESESKVKNFDEELCEVLSMKLGVDEIGQHIEFEEYGGGPAGGRRVYRDGTMRTWHQDWGTEKSFGKIEKYEGRMYGKGVSHYDMFMITDLPYDEVMAIDEDLYTWNEETFDMVVEGKEAKGEGFPEDESEEDEGDEETSWCEAGEHNVPPGNMWEDFADCKDCTSEKDMLSAKEDHVKLMGHEEEEEEEAEGSN